MAPNINWSIPAVKFVIQTDLNIFPPGCQFPKTDKPDVAEGRTLLSHPEATGTHTSSQL